MDPIDILIKLTLSEDIGSGDVTTEALFGKNNIRGIGSIMAKQDLVLSGVDVARRVFATVDPKLLWNCLYREGTKLKEGETIAVVQGGVASLLTAERTALNFLQQLSGIATWTARFVEAVQGTGVVIRDTRKTIPGLRTLSKQATHAGGAENHRQGLWDQFLIKDNHIAAAGGVRAALEKVLGNNPQRLKIQVEVRSAAEAAVALQAGADSLLLDNMTYEAVAGVARQFRDRVELEVSGNVTLENVARWSRTGVHAISIGALTHSAPAVDVSMSVEKS